MNIRRKAIVIGAKGQDGVLLSNLLEKKEYEVIKLGREPSEDKSILPINILEISEVIKIVLKFTPDEIYFLAAYHHASEEVALDEYLLFRTSIDINLIGLVNFIEVIRIHSPKTRLFYASSSHIFGDSKEDIQDENSKINPNTIYGLSKAAGYFACNYYREKYNLHISVGILYNHESIYRDQKFLSKKISRSVARIKKGLDTELILDSLDSSVDWGYAEDFVNAFFKIVQLEKSSNFVIATGIVHTVEDLVEIAFSTVGLDFRRYVRANKNMFNEPKKALRGNPSKLIKLTGWKPSLTFNEMIAEIVKNELKILNEK